MTAAMCRQDASTLLAKPQQEPKPEPEQQQRCSCSADMCAMPARVMECVYPCHLLVFGVDKRAQLTRQSGAGAQQSPDECSLAWWSMEQQHAFISVARTRTRMRLLLQLQLRFQLA